MILNRSIALLLISCLIGDPISASAFTGLLVRPVGAITQGTEFDTQALAAEPEAIPRRAAEWDAHARVSQQAARQHTPGARRSLNVHAFGFESRFHWTTGVMALGVSFLLGKIWGPALGPTMGWSLAAISGPIFTAALLWPREVVRSWVLRRSGLGRATIHLSGFGGLAVAPHQTEHPFQLFKSSFLALVTSFAVGAGLLVVASSIPIHAQPFHSFLSFLRLVGQTNLAYAAINLLPLFPLDGGNFVRAALWSWMGKTGATTVVVRLTQLSAVLGVAAGSYSVLHHPSLPWIALVSVVSLRIVRLALQAHHYAAADGIAISGVSDKMRSGISRFLADESGAWNVGGEQDFSDTPRGEMEAFMEKYMTQAYGRWQLVDDFSQDQFSMTLKMVLERLASAARLAHHSVVVMEDDRETILRFLKSSGNVSDLRQALDDLQYLKQDPRSENRALAAQALLAARWGMIQGMVRFYKLTAFLNSLRDAANIRYYGKELQQIDERITQDQAERFLGCLKTEYELATGGRRHPSGTTSYRMGIIGWKDFAVPLDPHRASPTDLPDVRAIHQYYLNLSESHDAREAAHAFYDGDWPQNGRMDVRLITVSIGPGPFDIPYGLMYDRVVDGRRESTMTRFPSSKDLWDIYRAYTIFELSRPASLARDLVHAQVKIDTARLAVDLGVEFNYGAATVEMFSPAIPDFNQDIAITNDLLLEGLQPPAIHPGDLPVPDIDVNEILQGTMPEEPDSAVHRTWPLRVQLSRELALALKGDQIRTLPGDLWMTPERLVSELLGDGPDLDRKRLVVQLQHEGEQFEWREGDQAALFIPRGAEIHISYDGAVETPSLKPVIPAMARKTLDLLLGRVVKDEGPFGRYGTELEQSFTVSRLGSVKVTYFLYGMARNRDSEKYYLLYAYRGDDHDEDEHFGALVVDEDGIVQNRLYESLGSNVYAGSFHGAMSKYLDDHHLRILDEHELIDLASSAPTTEPPRPRTDDSTLRTPLFVGIGMMTLLAAAYAYGLLPPFEWRSPADPVWHWHAASLIAAWAVSLGTPPPTTKAYQSTLRRHAA